MQKTIALALLAASLAAFPVATPSFAFDASKSVLCGPDAPEGYKRPGGYCDVITQNKSLMEAEDGCIPYVLTNFGFDVPARTVLVAEYCSEPPALPLAAI
ncbi:hypothetical protein [Devosia sp. A16]|uniref:hypothetical protein n=1 Tax=Devosia sp. A16 TaxID=1736675 RepID=UPI0006D7757A|nr:hypothetical protein [Devosia sp. A16]